MVRKERMYVANVLAYETPSTDEESGKRLGKGMWSVGISVANKLNGNNLLVGSFNPGGSGEDRKVGFITFRKKFNAYKKDENGKATTEEDPAAAREEAIKFATAQSAKFPIGSEMDDHWVWGDVDTEGSTSVGEGATVHFVEYLDEIPKEVQEQVQKPAAVKREPAQ